MNREEAEGPERGRSRPLGATAVALYLLLAPVWQIAALLLNHQVLRFGIPTWKNSLIYLLIAPAVGYLVWRRHARARFALYVFLTMEGYRAIKTGTFGLLVFCGAIMLYFQFPHVRRAYPRIQPGQVRARLRRWWGLLRHLGRGDPAA